MIGARLAPVLVALSLALFQVPSRSGPSDSAQERAYRSNNIGVAQLEQFDYDAAARSFRESLAVNPALALARLNLAIALFYGGKPAEAATEARAAVESLPASPQAHYVAGLIAKAEDRLDDAVTAFERVAAIDPRDAGAKVNLGQIHLQRRNYPEALTLFQAALAAEPFNVTAAYNVALALIRSGQAERGREAMQRFEALRDSAYGVTYAQLYLSQGRYGEAIASTGAEADLVDAAPPDVTFADAFTLPASSGSGGVEGRGGVTLFDADGDGDLDLLDMGSGARLYRNDQGKFGQAATNAGFNELRGSALLGAAAGDYDNDGKPDVLVLSAGGARLLRQVATGSFEDVSAKVGLPQSSGSIPATAAFADVDHDGDLDVVMAGSATQLLRNNGNGTFVDVTKDAGLAAVVTRAVAVAATDYDNRRDIDLLVLAQDRVPALYRNMRDGTFREVSADVGMPAAARYTALAAGDVNKDGYTDFFFGRTEASGRVALSDGQGAFRLADAPERSAGAIAAQFVDYDNDGLLDLVTLSPKEVRISRNAGGGKWIDVTDGARPAAAPAGVFQAMAIGDLDGDGAADLVLRTVTGELRGWRSHGGKTNRSLRVQLTARVSNRSSLGAKVEVRAGSLRQLRETSSSTPAIAPADLVFGLGARLSADVVRILWPAGILQAETARSDTSTRSAAMNVTELDRKPSSCPYLFTWNGARFEFVTDFMGGGEMGAWLGPAAWNQPDPDEYVRIRTDQLRPRDGKYELRVTNELEEGLFVDRLQLVAVDHPAGVDVFPNEGLRSPPRPAFSLTMTENARPPVSAVDEHGHDVRPQLASIDRRYPDDFHLLPIRGYAAEHTLTLDPGTDRDDIVLLMTGWTDYAFSNDNVAASQHGAVMQPPSVQVRDAGGRWRTVIDEIGFPVGRPQTVPVNMKGKFLSTSRQMRITTTMRIYWDQILVDTSGGFPARLTRIDPAAAQLRERGFSAEMTPDGREPFGYDYQRVSATSPWKVMVGRYTRLGDVRQLLLQSDDMFVVSRPGDEIALSFDVAAFPPLPPQWTRTFLLYADGYSKEMNPRSATPDVLGPLPFHAMTGYPYGPAEHYPRSSAHRRYLEQYNTRIVSRPMPSIDSVLLLTPSQRP